MSSAMMMLERSLNAPGTPNLGSQSTPTGLPGTAANWSMVPRCEMRFEKCSGGVKITCRCEDEVACGALQNLCKMLAGGLCSCCCTWNGMTVCQCNFCCGNCQCEMTKDGVCITCTTGDKTCEKMIQSCRETLACCLEAGCCCYVCFNNTPVCCCIC
jgi:hypothetical protein